MTPTGLGISLFCLFYTEELEEEVVIGSFLLEKTPLRDLIRLLIFDI